VKVIQALNQVVDLHLSSPYLTALRSLFLVATHHGVHVPPELLSRADPSDPAAAVLWVMREIGLTARLLHHRHWRDVSRLGSAYPAMAERLDGTWIIVASAVPTEDGTGALAVLDPAVEQSGIIVMSRAEFEAAWTGRLLLSKRRRQLADERQPFGLAWFVPEILRNRRYLRDVAVAALMTNIISFATPLFFNVLIDKVVPHRSYQTLLAVMLAFGAMILFDGMFGYVRQRLTLLASNKIDARLAARTFAHLLSLPLQFFEQNAAGVLLRDMQQTETIRHFLTGRLFQTLLDASALPLLLTGLAIYSGRLTLVVLAFALTMTGVIAVIVPVFRRQLERLYRAEGERQADLVETLHGIRTIKSLALERIRKAAWDSKVAASVHRREQVGRIGAVANVLTTGLEKLMQVSILGIGAVQVFDGHLSIGALVAFNMLAGRVTGPLVQMVALINEYQQTALSVKMLAKVMNHAPERDPNQRGSRPQVVGRLEFQGVRFRYEGSVTPALDDVSFAIEPGQMIGIVGRSGSGKTTLTRLIQGIHSAQEGLIRLDGCDVRNIDLTHLRRAIGVVLQDNFLFRGSIAANIAASRSDATLDEVMEAARLAGADEFIDRLPCSYETTVEENAANFSGGQRQRLAIARALLTKPRLLLFDEATSALDPESEAIVQQNLADIARGRTMIIVSHRLSTLVRADAILVLERGVVADFAPHAVLLDRCEIYRHLWGQQTRHMQ
jgi:subfamily B ATP-binding cassette protein HlyB/CyaB